jgi:very-short-patch-repair endonuclease
VGQALGWSLQLPVELVQQAQSVQRRTAQQPKVSQLQRRVYEALQGLGLEPQLEAPTDDGLFSVDMALAANERDGVPKTAVEVDGPHHFTSSGGKNGSTILRDFLLERRYGFRVISLPYFEIDKARTDADLQAYLSAKMASSRP